MNTEKKAIVVFYSLSGRTELYAYEISKVLRSLGYFTHTCSITECTRKELEEADVVFLGCLTTGLFFFKQKPEKEWVEFVRNFRLEKHQTLGLFTTYRISTGSMFRNMKKHISGLNGNLIPEFKSRTTKLSESDKVYLKRVVPQI